MNDISWNRLPSLTTLRAFEATARLQGYSAASRALNVTPAAVAQQVRKLEADLGLALVRREGRGLVLTRAGEQLSRPLHEAFSLIAGGIRDLKRMEASRGVRVSTTDYFAGAVILPRLREFWNAHPGQQISLSPDGNTAPVDPDRFDIAVRGGAPGQKWDGLQEIWLLETDMIICAAPALVGTGRIDVACVPWILDRGIGGNVFREAVRRAGCDPDTIEIVDPGDSRLELDTVLMGYGLYFTPELTVRDRLADGTLAKVDIELGMPGVYYALCPRGPIPGQTQKFLDWLVEICAPLSVEPPPTRPAGRGGVPRSEARWPRPRRRPAGS